MKKHTEKKSNSNDLKAEELDHKIDQYRKEFSAIFENDDDNNRLWEVTNKIEYIKSIISYNPGAITKEIIEELKGLVQEKKQLSKKVLSDQARRKYLDKEIIKLGKMKRDLLIDNSLKEEIGLGSDNGNDGIDEEQKVHKEKDELKDDGALKLGEKSILEDEDKRSIEEHKSEDDSSITVSKIIEESNSNNERKDSDSVNEEDLISLIVLYIENDITQIRMNKKQILKIDVGLILKNQHITYINLMKKKLPSFYITRKDFFELMCKKIEIIKTAKWDCKRLYKQATKHNKY